MGWLDRGIQGLRQSPVTAAAIIVTLLTLVVVGGVIFKLTTLGCGPAKALDLKGIASNCTGSTTAARPSPSYSFIPASPRPGATILPSSPSASSEPTPTVVPTLPNTNPSVPGGSPAYPTIADASGTYAPPASISNCRLPVYVGQSGTGGFIVFPGDTFVADPTSAVTFPSPSPGGPTPSPGPGYPGQNGQAGLTYDRAYSRWLPVSMQAVSGDGSRYASAMADGIFVVTISNGAVAELGAGHAWTVLSLGLGGVYATNPNQAGLWLLPYSGASPHEIIATGYWQAVGGGAAYGTPTSAVPAGATIAIQQLNLSSGALVDYFVRPGVNPQVVGFDASGVPVIYASTSFRGSEIWLGHDLLMAYEGQENAYGGYGPANGFAPSGPPVADSHGLWFAGTYTLNNASSAAIVVFIPGSGVFGVSAIGALLAGGGCS